MMQTQIEQDAVAILEALNTDFEQDCYSSSSPDELVSRLSIDRARADRAIDVLLANGWIEQVHQSLSGYDVQLTTFGKGEFDRQTHNTENERIRTAILHELALLQESKPYHFSDSNTLATTLGLSWNPVYFNLRILERRGFVKMSPYCGAGHPSATVQITSSGKAHHDLPPRRIIFISHAAADRHIAFRLRDAIETTFPRATVFVSSAPDVLMVGDPWVEKILDALGDCVIAIIITSERALSRSWVWFEAGAAWGRKVPMLCGCIGKQRKGSLPAPFALYQAANLDDTSDLEGIFVKLADVFGAPAKTADYASLTGEFGRERE
jgi:TIR domain